MSDFGPITSHVFGSADIVLIECPDLEPLPGFNSRRWHPIDDRRIAVAPSLLRELKERFPEAKPR